MNHVTENNPKLFFIDICIPWSQVNASFLEITFSDMNKLLFEDTLFRNCGGKRYIITAKSCADVVNHLVDDIDAIDSWNSYCFSRSILPHIPQIKKGLGRRGFD